MDDFNLKRHSIGFKKASTLTICMKTCILSFFDECIIFALVIVMLRENFFPNVICSKIIFGNRFRSSPHARWPNIYVHIWIIIKQITNSLQKYLDCHVTGFVNLLCYCLDAMSGFLSNISHILWRQFDACFSSLSLGEMCWHPYYICVTFFNCNAWSVSRQWYIIMHYVVTLLLYISCYCPMCNNCPLYISIM
mgnify:FL=1